MSDSVSDNRRIAKNTIYLYIRMFITMIVGLFTARIVLSALGVSDYGLNNVVGGLVTMFMFLRTSLVTGTQRFLNYSLGTGKIEESKKVFSTSLILYIAFAAIIVVVTEIVGLYLLKYKMTIDDGRMNAALIVFHLSLLGTAIGIVVSPFMGCIIAHERMSFIAYTSILDVVFKLLIVYLLLVVENVDKLIMYSVFYLIVGQIYNIIIYIYCRTKFQECRFSLKYVEPSLRKEMLAFSGWSMIGQVANMGASQGISILLNIFFNTTINAARGIASTVSGHIHSFIGNFQMASGPQIVKLCGNGDIQGMYHLANNTSKYSAFLYMLLAIPIYLEIEYILYLWLGIVPEYTSYFARIAMIQGLITCMNEPHSIALGATGFIKWVNIVCGSVLLLIVPVSYILLKLGVSLVIVYAVNVIPWVIVSIARIELLQHYVHVDSWEAYKNVYCRVFFILAICFIPSYMVHHLMDNGLSRLLVVTSFSLAWSGFVIYQFGLPPHLRKKLVSRVISIVLKKR